MGEVKRSTQGYLVLVLIVLAVFCVGLRQTYVAPIDHEITLDIRKGMSGYSVARALSANRLQSISYYILLRFSDYGRHMQIGEYALPQGLTLDEVFQALSKGKYRVAYHLTVVEGTTVHQVVDQLSAAEKLTGDVPALPAEGMLYPDTYTYYKGDKREVLFRAMHTRMEEALEGVWKNRHGDCALKTPQELLTLASLVEKETSVPAERPTVAGVYLSRLKKGMPLQADPTLVYGLSKGTGRLGRELSKNDLKIPMPYNTYLLKGLPPTAIAIPSLASLKAVAEPQLTGDLYFVATGKGDHVFSQTLKNHQRHHQALRRWRKTLKAAK